jgi:DNA-binding transcriptional MerR regulator
LYTVETALESLRKYDISESDLANWEKALNLEIPVDEYGRKQYSPHHINLFKNVKKHTALGRTLDEIRQIINLPPLVDSKPQGVTQREVKPAPQRSEEPVRTVEAKAVQKKSPYASMPKRPKFKEDVGSGAANVVALVQRLTREKDQLYKKLLETEKLNSHLYSANSLFHKKVKSMTLQINELRESLKENENFKLLDDKAKLHRQLLAAERLTQYKQEELQQQIRINEQQQAKIEELERRIQALTSGFDAQRFCGDWMETGHLVEVLYDNFGINIEAERVRLFRIPEVPSRIYGNTAIITTSYQYETNNLWRRNETLTVSCTEEDLLDGELVAEYILDGVPVAKALYRVTCRRNK